MILPGHFPPPQMGHGPSARPIDIHYADLIDSGADTNTYNLTLNFGDTASNRYLLAFIQASNSGLEGGFPSSVTIGGVTATRIAEGSSGFTTESWWIAPVPTGTSGSMTIARGGAGFIGVTGGLWRLRNLINPLTPVDAQKAAFDNPATTTLVVQQGGAVIAAAVYLGSFGENRTYTWTGVTEDYDDNSLSYSGAASASGGSTPILADSSSYVVTSTLDNSANNGHLSLSMR